MIRRFVLAASLTLALAGPAVAADKPPPIRSFDLPTIERLGAAIYRQDRAAWLATDALVKKVPDLKGAGVKGWIVEGEGGDEKVRFLRDTGAGLEAGYDILVTDKGAKAVVEPADRSLTAEERGAFAARQTAIKNLPATCRPGYNSVVVKDVEGDGWLVWLLAPSPAATTGFRSAPTGGRSIASTPCRPAA
jgi:opacity protein-like surface antigen